MEAKIYKVVNAEGTKYLPIPLVMGELVEQVEDENESDGGQVVEGYIRVRHNGGKEVSVFRRDRFKRVINKPIKS
jgi:hypothetical protein